MEDKNCELLFAYLKSILFDSTVQPLDISTLDTQYQKLGQGLQYLEKAVCEMKEYSAELSTGILSGFVPPRDNFLCSNLKNIHSNLNHLTWQAKQVAKGDYSQTVSYLGEFSTAFNTMTRQLQEREDSLKHEAQVQKEHAGMMENYNQLLTELIRRSHEDILVLSADDQAVLYSNQRDSSPMTDEAAQDYEIYRLCVEQTSLHIEQDDTSEDSYEWTWEAEDSDHRFYSVTSGRMKWQGQNAFTHIIHEITDEKSRERQLEAEAHRDTLTRIGNRSYFLQKAEESLAADESLIFCYCDLDYLKYINDKYGHLEGDWYLTLFANTVKNYIRKEDIFARIGGDEFCIILKSCPREMAEFKMNLIYTAFRNDSTRSYEKSFSYGIVEVPRIHPDTSVDEILQKADAMMYKQKRKHHSKTHPIQRN